MSQDTDTLVPDPQVAREFGVTLMSLWRWSHDPALGFPPRIQIKRKNYRSRRQIEEFKRRMMEAAIAGRETAA